MNDIEIPKEELDALRDARPGWQRDGLGFKGDVSQVSNTKANLVWESRIAFRRPELTSTAA